MNEETNFHVFIKSGTTKQSKKTSELHAYNNMDEFQQQYAKSKNPYIK